MGDERLITLMISSLLSDVAEKDFGNSFSELPIDSFALMELRLKGEEIIGAEIPDRDWVKMESPLELIAYLTNYTQTNGAPSVMHYASVNHITSQTLSGASARRVTTLNMPHMALGGLSESWLWKQLGDMHWEMICAGLEMPSHQLVDGNGERLYATFTRLRIESSAPLAAFAENDPFDISANIKRLGAGLFFSEATAKAREKSLRAEIMSSFTKRGSITSNINLLKGQPTIPPHCLIPELPEMPEFGRVYRDRRNTAVPSELFSCEYDIIPYYDINGVGLLYFAAYPLITDICELKYINQGNAWADAASVISRDIFYFANCNMDERIIYRVHARRQQGTLLELESSLTRKSDGMLMAYVLTRKVLKHG